MLVITNTLRAKFYIFTNYTAEKHQCFELMYLVIYVTNIANLSHFILYFGFKHFPLFSQRLFTLIQLSFFFWNPFLCWDKHNKYISIVSGWTLTQNGPLTLNFKVEYHWKKSRWKNWTEFHFSFCPIFHEVKTCLFKKRKMKCDFLSWDAMAQMAQMAERHLLTRRTWFQALPGSYEIAFLSWSHIVCFYTWQWITMNQA